MLVLTRKLMEKLYIGPDVCVTVVRLEGGQVRLGIDAPREVPVVRAELMHGRTPAAEAAAPAPAAASGPAPSPAQAQAAPAPMAAFRTRQAGAHGTGSPRREPSR